MNPTHKRKLKSGTSDKKRKTDESLQLDQEKLDFEYEDKEEKVETGEKVTSKHVNTKPTRHSSTSCRECEGCHRQRCEVCNECRTPQNKKKCIVTKCRQNFTPEDFDQMHEDWTKSIRAAYKKQTEQLEKEIELQKAVNSITQPGGDEEDSDFQSGSGSKTKARIKDCS